jgi:type I restriction enzyme, S subunit
VSEWKTVRLSEFCRTGTGGTPSRSNLERYYEGGTIPWVKSGELRESVITETEEHVTEAALRETNVKLVPAGALLLAMYGATVGRLGILGVEATTNQAVCHIVPDPKAAEVRFLFHALSNQVASLVARGVGGAQPNISQGIVKDLKLALPPLAEQRRIAEVLDLAEALRAKRRAALAQLDSLTRSLFLDLFADPASNGWAMTNIGSVAKLVPGSIRTGPFGSQLLHGEFTDSGIAVLGIDNAVANEFRLGERRFISEAKYRQLKRYTVHPGDVLITIMGTCGRCAVVPDDIPAAINTKHLCCITLDAAKCTPVFLHAYFLRHPIARQYLTQTAKGAIMSGLNMGIIKEMPVPLPPLSLQREFARRVTAVDKLKTAQRASLAELDALFATLQHRAFRGEL